MKLLRVTLVFGLIVLLYFFASEVRTPTGMLSLEDANASDCLKASDIVGSGETIFLNDTVVQAGVGYCIELDVSNITLDCQGFEINGTEACSGAILVANDSITVSGCSFNLFTNGRVIFGQNVVNVTIMNNSLTSNEMINISGNNNKIIGNSFDRVAARNGASGLLLSGSGTVAGNTISNGVSLTLNVVGDDIVVENNTVENITGIAYKIQGNNVTFINNTARNITGVAVDVVTSTEVYLINNTVEFINKKSSNILGLFFPSLPDTGESGYAFRLFNSLNTTLRGNIVSLSNPNNLPIENDGIVVLSSDNTYVINNSIDTVRTGIYIMRSDNNTVENNTLTDCIRKGVIIDGGVNNNVNRNRINAPSAMSDVFRFKRGLEFFRTSSAASSSNRINGYWTGLFVYNSTDSVFDDTNISASGHGLFSQQSLNNTFNRIRVSSSLVGLKFLLSNSSIVNNSNFTATGFSCDLSRSSFNNVTRNRFVGDSCIIGYNSALNNISSNTFVSAAAADITFDLFANNNNGTGNTIPLGFIQRNFASSNNVI